MMLCNYALETLCSVNIIYFRLQKYKDFLDWQNIFAFVVNLEHLYSFVLEHGLDGLDG